MNLCLFFEGTGSGVAGNITNVTRMKDLCREDAEQRIHLEPGPGAQFPSLIGGKLAGTDWRRIFRSACNWFETNSKVPSTGTTRTHVFLFGFSRGAFLARHFADWLDKRETAVDYLGLWDTVDAIPGIDVAETCPPNVRAVRHAIARDEERRFFTPVRINANPAATKQRITEILFPGSHSDVGGLYDDNHVVADVSLAWIAAGAKREGLRLRTGIDIRQKAHGTPVFHDSHTMVSNAWGAFGRVKRCLKGLRLHRSFWQGGGGARADVR